jgi:hypothetical protein
MPCLRVRCLLFPLLAIFSLGLSSCRFGLGSPLLYFRAPLLAQLSQPGDVAVDLQVPAFADLSGLQVQLDGEPVDLGDFVRAGRSFQGDLAVDDEGQHLLHAALPVDLFFFHFTLHALTKFELAAFENPDECEVLNRAGCLLPYPSSRYLEPASTATGVRVSFPADAMPPISGGQDLFAFLSGFRQKLDPTPYGRGDGFSPTVQVLMHFPGGVDLAASDAARLHSDTRNFDLRSLEAGSPSVLIDAETGERVAHFLENDSRATGELADRQLTFLRPARSLRPGHRYIGAIRRLRDRQGELLQPEPAFAALRDRHPTTIAAIESRRQHFEELFGELAHAGVRRHALQLAFDFRVASDESLAGAMLAMRDQALAWVATQDPADLFQVSSVEEITPPAECHPGAVWRFVRGTFASPLFLITRPLDGSAPAPADNIAEPDQLGFLSLDADGVPVRTGTSHPPFGIAIPCAALDDGSAPPLVFGHGLFGNGPDTVRNLAQGLGDTFADLVARGLVPQDVNLDYVTGGTNWSGLSSLEVPPLPDELPSDLGEILSDPVLLQQVLTLLQSFIGQIFLDFDRFGALPDRLQQGQLNTLVLARLLETGVFNAAPAFQTLAGDPSSGVIDVSQRPRYFGASLGGIMGLMFLALSPSVDLGNVDVPAINFSLLLQRAKPFKPFQDFLDIVAPDPLTQVLGLQLLHELWVRGESAGYANHITGETLPPFPGTNTKRVLMTVARFDQQVSTLAAQISAATLGLPNLVGSVETNLPLVPDVGGPLASAHVMYDTGSYVLGEDDQYIPPLTNRPAAVDDNDCDPHGLQALIPAALWQLSTFLRSGEIENFCNGACDAAEPLELPFGADEACQPGS